MLLQLQGLRDYSYLLLSSSKISQSRLSSYLDFESSCVVVTAPAWVAKLPLVFEVEDGEELKAGCWIDSALFHSLIQNYDSMWFDGVSFFTHKGSKEFFQVPLGADPQPFDLSEFPDLDADKILLPEKITSYLMEAQNYAGEDDLSLIGVAKDRIFAASMRSLYEVNTSVPTEEVFFFPRTVFTVLANNQTGQIAVQLDDDRIYLTFGDSKVQVMLLSRETSDRLKIILQEDFKQTYNHAEGFSFQKKDMLEAISRLEAFVEVNPATQSDLLLLTVLEDSTANLSIVHGHRATMLVRLQNLTPSLFNQTVKISCKTWKKILTQIEDTEIRVSLSSNREIVSYDMRGVNNTIKHIVVTKYS